MSVLSFPRLYFQGYLSWDPNVTNNSSRLWDPLDANVVLPPGVTLDTYIQFVIDTSDRFGNWNIYGSHACDFVQFQSFTSTVTGGSTGEGTITSGDAVIGQPLSMPGRLVDLNPLTVDTSQYFFDRFSIGSLLSAPASQRMHSRWINFSRNLNTGGDPRIQIAGVAGVVWQTTFPSGSLKLDAGGSKLLGAFQEALALPDVRGLMVRFNVYRTLYFQNGVFNDIAETPQNEAELKALYEQGKMFSNPAYSVVTGTVGLWTRNDVPSVPNGRYLLPNQGTTQPTGLGPVVCGYNTGLKVLSLDFGAAIPELDFDLNKQSFGTLTVAAGGTTIATIDESQYGREAYQKTGGIIDVPISDPAPLRAGLITITGTQDGAPIEMYSEAALTAQTTKKNIYLDEKGTAEVTVYVADTGRPAAAGTLVQIAQYPQNQSGPMIQLQPLKVGADGLAQFSVSATVPGYRFFLFTPFKPETTPPPPPPGIDVMTDFYCGVRTLPFDDALNRDTPDSALTWEWVYANILQPFNLCPAAAMRARDIGLDQKAIWDNPKGAGRIKAVTAASNFERTGYMPITRELSNGMRNLLARWADLVIAGKAPSAAPEPESVHPAGRTLIREAL